MRRNEDIMLTNDATILKIKHEVLYQVAKLAYEGEFEEKKDELPYKLLLDQIHSSDAVYTKKER